MNIYQGMPGWAELSVSLGTVLYRSGIHHGCIDALAEGLWVV